MRRSRFGTRVMTWKDVDLGDVRLQMSAATNFNRSHPGRLQLVIEFAQAGIISTDQARKLFQHPDLEREISLYTAVIEVVELDLDEIREGGTVMPDPMTNLEIAVWRGQREYAQWLRDRAPEDRLEALRQYVINAAYMQSMAAPSNANAPAVAPAGPVDAGVPPIADVAGQPTAALSDQAMTLRAS